MTPAERAAALEAIAEEVRACTACRLHRGRTHAVPGEGHPDTEVVFVGEGPGQNEDQQGRPFVGAAGGLLEELLDLVGWRRDEVFITNVVKCRPPGNRDPEPDEIAACAGYLRRQLALLDPAVIVTLGRFSLATFMPGAKISSAHGTVRPVDPASGAPSAVAYAMYHPAAAFRQAALRETLVADMANLPQVLIDARAARAASSAERGDGKETPAAGAVVRGDDTRADETRVPDVGADGWLAAPAAPMPAVASVPRAGAAPRPGSQPAGQPPESRASTGLAVSGERPPAAPVAVDVAPAAVVSGAAGPDVPPIDVDRDAADRALQDLSRSVPPAADPTQDGGQTDQMTLF